MRYLKKKIALSFQKKAFKFNKSLSMENPDASNHLTHMDSIELVKKINKHQRSRTKLQARQEKLAFKNILKNYGRAIANFAASDMAIPYLEEIIKEKNVSWKGFVQYAHSMRDFIQNIETFRDSMLRNEYETQQRVDYKEIFRRAAEVFMKYFSVNWIFSGKMLYKMEYLKIRGTLLRRIKNPSSFTFLKSTKPKLCS